MVDNTRYVCGLRQQLSFLFFKESVKVTFTFMLNNVLLVHFGIADW